MAGTNDPTQAVNQAFEDALASMGDTYSKASATGGNNWKPPAGEKAAIDYVCQILEFRRGVSVDKSTGKPSPWFQPTYRILEGEYEGRSFSGDFLSLRDENAAGRTKGYLNTLAGFEVEDVKSIVQILDSGVGAVVRVGLKKSKDGKYVNTYLQERLGLVEAGAES